MGNQLLLKDHSIAADKQTSCMHAVNAVLGGPSYDAITFSKALTEYLHFSKPCMSFLAFALWRAGSRNCTQPMAVSDLYLQSADATLAFCINDEYVWAAECMADGVWVFLPSCTSIALDPFQKAKYAEKVVRG